MFFSTQKLKWLKLNYSIKEGKFYISAKENGLRDALFVFLYLSFLI